MPPCDRGPIAYNEFDRYLEDGKVGEIAAFDKYIQSRLKEPLENGKQEFATTRVVQDFAQQLREHAVTFVVQIERAFLSDLPACLLKEQTLNQLLVELVGFDPAIGYCSA